MSTESRLASHLLLAHDSRVVYTDELSAWEWELLDKVLAESDNETQGDWCCEGVINLHTRSRGLVQIRSASRF